LPFVFVHGADWFGSASLADGKSVTTGLVGAYLGVELVKLAFGITAKTGDAFALPLALGLAIGRWGCFCHGCCHGTATNLPWGSTSATVSDAAYGSLFHLTMAMVLLVLMARNRFRDNRLKFYQIAYGGFRFLTEFIRPEPM
jgi:phosphatidylglycerol:prolipoprotein diacylglycerol transferase